MSPSRTSRPLLALALVSLALAASSLLTACGPDTSEADKLLNDKLISRPSKEVSVFYPAADTIIEQKIVLDSDKNAELEALRALFRGAPKGATFKASIPTATVNSVSVKKDHAIVDFGRDILKEGGSEEQQRVALLSVIYTLKQFTKVKKVSFSVEGRTSGTLDGKDVERFWGKVTLAQMPWSVVSEGTIDDRVKK